MLGRTPPAAMVTPFRSYRGRPKTRSYTVKHECVLSANVLVLTALKRVQSRLTSLVQQLTWFSSSSLAMASRMWRGVTRPFLLSLAALPANSNISAGGTEKHLEYVNKYEVTDKRMFWSRVVLPGLTNQRLLRNHRVWLTIVAVSLLFYSVFHRFKMLAHSFDVCGHFGLLWMFCQRLNEWMNLNQDAIWEPATKLSHHEWQLKLLRGKLCT